MSKPPSSLLKRTSQTKKLSKFNLSKLLSKVAIPLFVVLLTSACVLGNLQAKTRGNFLEEDSSIFISLITPSYEQELEVVKNTSQTPKPQQSKLFALASPVSAFDARQNQTYQDNTLSSRYLAGDVLVKTTAPRNGLQKFPQDKIITYEVKGGETVSHVAAKFGISQNTIFWANESLLKYADSVIKPGDTLKILSVTGLAHQVKNGETLEAIVQKYQADLDQTLSYNKLINASDIEEGQVLIIPGGRKAEPELKPKPRPVYLASRRSYYSRPSYYRRGSYGGGYCTNYVNAVTGKNIGGNAGTWLSGARAKGYEIGNTPRAGAIIVTNESWVGHVGVIKSVNNDGTITITEQNYKGYGIVSERTLPASSGRIKGYVY